MIKRNVLAHLWLTLTTPARDSYMATTPILADFVRSWAMQADRIDLDFEEKLEIRGRARPFRGVQILEFSDGIHDPVPVSRLNVQDFTCMQRLLSDRRIRWCFHPLVSDTRQDIFPYDCLIIFDHPTEPEDVERAKETYVCERADVK